MTAISQNHLEFAARLARIEQNIAGSRQLLFVGVDEVYSLKRRDRKPKPSRGRVVFGNLWHPVSLVLPVALGILSHGIGQVLRFHVQGMQAAAANPDVEMLVQIVLGFAIVTVLGYVLRSHNRAVTTLKSAGVVLGLLFFHNAVHLWPLAFAKVTSALWVNDIVADTKPYSLLWRGITFLLG